jgi:hypothetical protein
MTSRKHPVSDARHVQASVADVTARGMTTKHNTDMPKTSYPSDVWLNYGAKLPPTVVTSYRSGVSNSYDEKLEPSDHTPLLGAKDELFAVYKRRW